MNAIMHRDYFEDRFGVFVEIFDDRVEITDRGKLLFDRKELGKISNPRNPIIFDRFYRSNLIEKIGSGINRIKKQIKERGLKVKFETDDFFRVTFYRSSIEGKSSGKILDVIKENQKISIPEIAERLSLTTCAIEKSISKLKQARLLKRIGPAKCGYWKIKEVQHE